MAKRLALALLTLLCTTFPAQAEFKLDVDISSRQLVAVDDGKVLGRYDVAVGSKDKPTPTGSFNIRKIVWNPPWHPPDEKWARGKTAKGPGDPDNPMKRVKIFFSEPDYYIHGTDALDSLGAAESHGCLRMHPDDVTDLARMVMTAGGKPQPEPWY